MNKNYTIRREGNTEYIEITPPKALFKYQSINDYSVKALIDNKIFGTTPSSFNDSYDTAFCYRKNFLIKQIVPLLSEEKKQKYVDFFGANSSNDAIGCVIDEIIKSLNGDFRTNYVVSCFSEKLSNDVMWGQYANKSTGFVTEYSGQELFQKSRETNEVYNFLIERCNGGGVKESKTTTIMPVIYNNGKFNCEDFIITSINKVLDYYGDICSRRTNYLLKESKYRVPLSVFSSFQDELDKLFYNSICRKKKVWSYEKEWRIWSRNISSITSTTPDTYCEICTEIKPKAIYLGECISKYNTIALCAVAKDMEIPVYKMKTVMTKTSCKLVKELFQSV